MGISPPPIPRPRMQYGTKRYSTIQYGTIRYRRTGRNCDFIGNNQLEITRRDVPRFDVFAVLTFVLTEKVDEG